MILWGLWVWMNFTLEQMFGQMDQPRLSSGLLCGSSVKSVTEHKLSWPTGLFQFYESKQGRVLCLYSFRGNWKKGTIHPYTGKHWHNSALCCTFIMNLPTNLNGLIRKYKRLIRGLDGTQMEYSIHGLANSGTSFKTLLKTHFHRLHRLLWTFFLSPMLLPVLISLYCALTHFNWHISS